MTISSRIGLWLRQSFATLVLGATLWHGALESANAQDAAALKTYLAPSAHVLGDLQLGLRRLQPLCKNSSVPNANTASVKAITQEIEQSRLEWQEKKNQAQEVLRQFTEQSDVRKRAWCRYALEGWTVCDDYHRDLQRLALIEPFVATVFSEAQQRLALYEQYAQLEARACTNAGFTQRLWQVEKRLLWPLVSQSPAFLSQQLKP